MRSWKWNDNWKFWKEKNAFSMAWSVPEEAESIRLPHDAMIYEKPQKDSAGGTATAFRDAGFYNYVKTFFIPKEKRGKKILLRFEGIYRNAVIFLNGEYVTEEKCGYTVFYADITNLINYDMENEVRVQVHAGGGPGSRWYSGAGIYRDVYWLESDLCRIVPDGVWTETENITEEGFAVILVKTDICNESEKREELELFTTVGKEGKTVRTAKNCVILLPGEKRTVCQRMMIPNAKTWDADLPELYDLESSLRYAGGTEADMHKGCFGIRKLSLIPGQGLLVNGKMVKLRGACIHHDHGIIGAAGYEAAEFRKIRLLKEAGFNAVRMSHHPCAPALLRACDSLGMYVMDEAFDMWFRGKSDYDYSLSFRNTWEDTMEAMVKTDRQHPSVILYSIGNEIPEAGGIKGAAIAEKISAAIREMDISRYILQAVNGAFACGDRMGEIISDIMKTGDMDGQNSNVNDFMTVMNEHMGDIVVHPIVSRCVERAAASLDIVGYNYMEARYEQDALAYPDRMMVGSETNPPVIAENWKKVQNIPNLIGDFTWTGWDYLGEAGIGIAGYTPDEGGFGVSYPVQLAYVGDLDITGYRRPMSYYREIAFGLRREPYIAVQDPDHFGDTVFKTPWVLSDAVSSWNWPGREGKKARVEVYSAGPRVRLLLNGRLIGEKEYDSDGPQTAVFEVPYEEGTLEAVCVENNIETGSCVLCTAKGEKILSVRKESVPCQDEHVLYWYTITAEDINGNLFTDSYDEIQIKSVKNLRILGVGSANPKPQGVYQDHHTSLFQGRAQIVAEKLGEDPELEVEFWTEE